MNWACTKTDDSNNDMFMTMFRYISGANEGNVQIPMTAPVSTKWSGEGREMCFFIEKAHQANPPVPTDSSVNIVNRPAMNVYTRYEHTADVT